MQTETKEVYFNVYCKTCKYQPKAEHEDPCHDCLSTPANINSHKPINYEEA